VVRALERVRAGSATQAAWQAAEPPWRVTYVGLTLPRARLARQLASRAGAMVAAGLADEVRALLRRGYGPALPAMQGIGYRQFVDVVRGRLDAAAALALMQRETVRYARRQHTWFAREPGIQWIDVQATGDVEAVAAAIEARLEAGGGIE
jgi:tRNA dimethylallyltransferase